MNDKVIEKVEAITELTKKAGITKSATDALKFSQAALNLANVASIFHYMDTAKEKGNE